MLRTRVSIVTAVLLSAAIVTASAQQMTPPASAAPDAPKAAATADAPKMSRFKLTREKLKTMRAKWKENRGKLKACRAEVRKKGLIGDDRWFYISACMEKA